LVDQIRSEQIEIEIVDQIEIEIKIERTAKTSGLIEREPARTVRGFSQSQSQSQSRFLTFNLNLDSRC